MQARFGKSTPVVAERKTREQLNIRATAQQRDLIDRAAEIKGLTRTDFIMLAAVREAETVIVDQVFIKLTPAEHDNFLDLLENPPEPTGELKKLMRETASRL